MFRSHIVYGLKRYIQIPYYKYAYILANLAIRHGFRQPTDKGHGCSFEFYVKIRSSSEALQIYSRKLLHNAHKIIYHVLVTWNL